MKTLTDFLYHATGMCGEHWHPNAINIGLISLILFAAYKHKQRKTEKG